MKKFFVKVRNIGYKISDFFYARPLLKYSLGRLASSLFTIFLVVTVTFILLRTLNVSSYFAGLQKIPAEMRELVRERILQKMGLDKPIFEQLMIYYKQLIPYPKQVCIVYEANFGDCVRSTTIYVDLGVSTVLRVGAPVWPIIKQAMPNSFKIGAMAVLLEMAIGYPLGVLMAKNKGRWLDKLGNAYIILVDAIPPVVYYYVIYFFILRSHLLPTLYISDDPLTFVAPVIVLAVYSVSEIMLWIRRYMVDELNADYVKFARSKGLSENTIMFKHILRNAIVPFVRTIPISLISTLMGGYFIERLFGISGIGTMMLNALNKRDNTFVQALVLIFSGISTIAYLLGDIVTALFDPRIKLSTKR